MEVILLLTGCIKPNVIDKMVWNNPEVRKQQYIDAINWYLENTPYKLIFAENSNTDISSYFRQYEKRIEFMTYESLPIIPDRSRSYKEMEILEYVYNNSELIDSTGVIVKITGRLQLLNIVKLTDYVVSKAMKYTNGFVSAYKNINRPDSDCKYIWFSPNFLPILIAQKEHVYADYPFEWATGDAIRNAKLKGFHFIYPLQPSREHGRGGNGGVYDRTDEQFRKMMIIHQIKKIGFDFGIFPLK